MKPALLKTLAIVLIGALLVLGGLLHFHGGWENLKEDWTGNYRERPIPINGGLTLGPDGYYWGITGDSYEMLVFRRRNDRSFKRLSVSSGWCNLG